MSSSEALQRENEALRGRISRLNEAILRINSRFDLGTVLHAVVDSARALTGARYGVITTIDQGRQVQDFVSSGFSPEEHRELANWRDGPRLFEHLRDLPETVRLREFSAFLRSHGFSTELFLAKAVQATPMRHRGEPVGYFFLGRKEGGLEFTPTDEEVLVLFASQAATAIANARTHENERRVRANLETLVETSPVGVAVLDARTGDLVSFNQEARRIVDGLRTPDEAPRDLLKTRRRAGSPTGARSPLTRSPWRAC